MMGSIGLARQCRTQRLDERKPAIGEARSDDITAFGCSSKPNCMLRSEITSIKRHHGQ